MSKQELRQAAFENGGVSYEESLEAEKLQPTIYERIGEDGFIELSNKFYERVFEDKKEQWFLNIFASSTKQEAIENQYRFLVQIFGGPDLYRWEIYDELLILDEYFDSTRKIQRPFWLGDYLLGRRRVNILDLSEDMQILI